MNLKTKLNLERHERMELENPQLYEVAKKVTLAAGLSWTDPRTGDTYWPKRKQKRIPEEKGDCPLCPVCLEESDRILKGLKEALGLA